MQTGFFVDWNGQVRCTDEPGPGMACDVYGDKVDVVDGEKFVTYEATYYPTVKAVLDVAPSADLSLVQYGNPIVNKGTEKRS